MRYKPPASPPGSKPTHGRPPPRASEVHHASTFQNPRKNGFTLTELIVIIGMAGMLIILLTPALSQIKAPAKSIQCMANMRRLAGGWRMFAEDNSDKLVPNYEGGSSNSAAWSGNWLSWDVDSMNTNEVLMRSSALAQYFNGDITPFRCPADTYVSPPQQARGWRGRVRSVSMNGFMGQQSSGSDPTRNGWYPQYRQWLKLSEVSRPADYFVFIEEHPDSINDGWFINNPTDASLWVDFPASYHSGSANLSFADQHVETPRWRSSLTKVPIRFVSYNNTPIDSLGQVDHQWLLKRSAAPF